MVSKYAMILGEEVYNLAVFETREEAIRVSQAIKGSEATAVNVDYIDVRFGATYIDGKFYNVNENGTKTLAETQQTEVQRLTALEATQDDLTLTIASMIGGED